MRAARSDLFVGRLRELAVLRTRLAAARHGQGGVVLLIGEPGIGKTRMLDEIAREGRADGVETLVGRCYEGAGAPVFWPWLQVLRGYVRARDGPTLRAELGPAASDVAAVFTELSGRIRGLPQPPALPPLAARFRFFDGVTTALVRAAALRPLLLTLDDLQNADEPSLLLLQFLARAAKDAAVLVVGAMQRSGLSPEHPLHDPFGELFHEEVVERMILRGLRDAEVGDLLAHVTGEVPRPDLTANLHARTEGNPLYVIEIARTLAAEGGLAAASPDRDFDVPDTVHLAIWRTLRSLSKACRDLLTLAALFGREFRVDALVQATGFDSTRVLALLDEAQAARIVDPIRDDPRSRRFAHMLLGESLVAVLGGAARAALHRRVAEALAVDPRAEERPAEVAHHWLQAGAAGDPELAVAWTLRAAERALRLFAYDEAARRYRSALEVLDGTRSAGGARRAELLLGLGEACNGTGEVVEARRAFIQAAAGGRELGSADLLTRAALGFAPPETYAEHPEPDATAVRLLEEATSAWSGRDAGLHARALARLAGMLSFDDRERAESLSDRSIAMARRVGDAAVLCTSLAGSLAVDQRRQEPSLRLGVATELVGLAQRVNDLESLAVGRFWRSIHLLETGDAHSMRREQAALVRLAPQLHQPVWAWYARRLEGACALLDGRFEDAERSIGAAFELGQGMLPYAARSSFVSAMVVLRILQGRPGEFAPEYRSAFEGNGAPAANAPLVWVESERGSCAEARRALQRVLAEDLEHVPKDAHWTLAAACLLTEACAFLADPECAARLYELVAPVGSQWVVWAEGIPLGPVAYYRGLLARTLGHLDQAVLDFASALSASVLADARPWIARTQYEYTRLLRMRGAAGDAERARLLFAEARVIGESVGMAGLCRKLDALDTTESSGAVEVSQVFRQEGDYWTIAYSGRVIRMRDLRGLHYLGELLRHPGREIHAIELAALERTMPSSPVRDPELSVSAGLGDAGVRLDHRARIAYRQRLEDLADEDETAEQRNDLGRLERVRAERRALIAELAAASRGRRDASHAERARVAVAKAIKLAIVRVTGDHPVLGAHLAATIRCGYFCSYVPDPRQPIEWEM
jgi:tetratricopeptide (TPR) repeat protein